MADLLDLSLAELSRKLQAREVSSFEAFRAALRRVLDLDPRVKAFLLVDENGAMQAVGESDRRLAAGAALSPLDGVPVALKDIFCTRGLPTTAGSRILEGWIPPYDATVVRKLREAGAVIVGKLNMDEFAMGSSTENSAYQVTRNPWDLERTPGGSSGGSAAAVAARMCFGALGTDTGGSIRQPAALTGTVGMKPTYGRVSRYGVVAFASSLDQVGPIGRTVRDAAMLLQCIAGPDPRDATSAPVAVPDYLAEIESGAKGLRLGVPREYFDVAGGMDPEVERSVRAAIEVYRGLGAEVREVSLPHTKYGIGTYYLVATAEASSNLARYDGVKYGHRAAAYAGLRDLYARSRDEGFGDEVKRRIMLGTYALSSGYYDAYYLKAQKVRTLIRRDFDAVFREVDAVVCPTSPTPAFRIGEKTGDPLQMYLADVFTVTIPLAGLPGLSLPCGFTDGGLPIGLQIIGRAFDEARMFRLARAYERETRWTERRPALLSEAAA